MNSYTGIVQKGPKRGTVLGYPTANIPLKDKNISGIYAARVLLEGEAPYTAAAYADQKRKLLEAHILDFSDSLYGVSITVELHKKIREVKAFPDDGALKAAIAQDIAEIRETYGGIKIQYSP